MKVNPLKEFSLFQFKQSKISNIFFWAKRNRTQIKYISIPFVLLLILAVYILVYFTGGIKYVYSHTMYLPILTGGALLGLRGGVLTGIIAGIALGPFMPIEVATGEPQALSNWLYRTLAFVVAGGLCGIASDAVRKHVDYLYWLQQYNAETGLPNRDALSEVLIPSGVFRKKAFNNLIVLHISNFDELEVTYGLDTTAVVIRNLSNRLAKQTEIHSQYHINFNILVLITETNNINDLRKVAERLISVCSQPFTCRDFSVHADIRIGYTAIDKIDVDAPSFIRRIEAAVRKGGFEGRSCFDLSSVIDFESVNENSQLLGELKRALSKRELELHYQPKIYLNNGDVYGVEALMRWKHPKLGNIPPGKFIPRAEQSTLINQLTHWAIGEALRQLKHWNDAGIALTMAVNISGRDLSNPNFVSSVAALLEKHNIKGNNLELEITESSMLIEFTACINAMRKLSKLGVILSVDDFGTGYSSLQYLAELPVSAIKIDQSFIKPLDNGVKHSPIVNATIDLSHSLNRKVIAEGVETYDSLNYLKKQGCDIAQGYLISRPIPASEFKNWYVKSHGSFHTHRQKNTSLGGPR